MEYRISLRSRRIACDIMAVSPRDGRRRVFIQTLDIVGPGGARRRQNVARLHRILILFPKPLLHHGRLLPEPLRGPHARP